MKLAECRRAAPLCPFASRLFELGSRVAWGGFLPRSLACLLGSSFKARMAGRVD
jgi:hypothetical protein